MIHGFNKFSIQPRVTSAPATPFHVSSAFDSAGLKMVEGPNLKSLEGAGWSMTTDLTANVFVGAGASDGSLNNVDRLAADAFTSRLVTLLLLLTRLTLRVI